VKLHARAFHSGRLSHKKVECDIPCRSFGSGEKIEL
jgi:hypothetical protein